MTSTEAWMPISQLPCLDGHMTIITAVVDEVWPSTTAHRGLDDTWLSDSRCSPGI